MSKALEATCAAGIVKVNNIPVPSAQKFCEGVGSSSGVLFLDKDKAFYFANTVADLKTTLQKVTGALSQIATALTSLDGKPTGGVSSAVVPLVAANVTQITSLNAELTTLTSMLK